ncbi:minor histocompatibility antigen H13 [Rhodotorula toruloides]|uniref:Minor histocompatibility antigen H13 n=1 Tax=Rhodotorula toruloides TaxID=5286 RepID=A0A511KCQ6_RHOTO|nr:minor histocompatibility antigen H13 [Rhodotorula toruloides]
MSSAIGLYQSYAALLAGALGPIWAGAHSSLVMPKAEKCKLRKLEGREGKTEADEEEDDEDEDVERLTASPLPVSLSLNREDAYWFPILGSGVLLGLFLLFKYVDKALLNKILGWYLAAMAVAGLARSGVKLARRAMGEKRSRRVDKWRLKLTKNSKEHSTFSFSSLHLYCIPLAIALSASQVYTGNWILSNLVALSFAFNAISLLYLDSFATGSILLAGLFVYDIWWVFGSKAVFGKGANVMVDVATSFEAPIKIVFPKNLARGRDFTLLGLGDIVLPGVFLALALRFDYHLALKRLATTILVMHTFRAAQPALLYLSPACIVSVSLCALARGDWGELWSYVEGEEDEKERRKREKREQREGEKAGKEVKVDGKNGVEKDEMEGRAAQVDEGATQT